MLYQVAVAGASRKLTFLESCGRAYVDGNEEPEWLSSGLEDDFLGTYYFNLGIYQTEVAGVTYLDAHRFCGYRFHEEDPFFFSKSLRLTIRCGEQTDRETWKAPEALYTTYVWTYEW